MVLLLFNVFNVHCSIYDCFTHACGLICTALDVGMVLDVVGTSSAHTMLVIYILINRRICVENRKPSIEVKRGFSGSIIDYK